MSLFNPQIVQSKFKTSFISTWKQPLNIILIFILIFTSCKKETSSNTEFIFSSKIRNSFEKVLVPNDTTRHCILYYGDGNIHYFSLFKLNKGFDLKQNPYLKTVINNDTVYLFTGIERFTDNPITFPRINEDDIFVVKDSMGKVTDFWGGEIMYCPPPKKSTAYLSPEFYESGHKLPTYDTTSSKKQ